MKAITLLAARKRAGLTQEQLEEKSGVPQGVISKLERNADARPAFDTVIKLSHALGVEATRLRFGRGRQEQESIAS